MLAVRTMCEWMKRRRVWISMILAAAFLTLSLCPSECLASAAGSLTTPTPGCHENAPGHDDGSRGHDTSCCVLAVASAAPNFSADTRANDSFFVLATPVRYAASDFALSTRAAPANPRCGPGPLHARSPILLI